MRGLNALGLQRKTSTIPASTNKLVTKGELNTYFYVDNEKAGISSYPDNRIITYDHIRDGIFSKPSVPYYQYDVTRSGIPGAQGAFFEYVGTDESIYTIMEDSYGYVGRFCMQDGSFRNNQWNVYSISEVGDCYPTPIGSFPQPYLSGGYLYFSNLGQYQVEDVKVHQIVDAKRMSDETKNNLALSEFAVGTGTAVGLVATADDEEQVDTAIWVGVFTLLAIAATWIFGGGKKATAQLRYTSQGVYTNGFLSMASIKNASGSNQFYISYKVNSGYGYYAAVFGYGANELRPPLVTY